MAVSVVVFVFTVMVTCSIQNPARAVVGNDGVPLKCLFESTAERVGG